MAPPDGGLQVTLIVVPGDTCSADCRVGGLATERWMRKGKGEEGIVKKPYIHYAPVRVSLSLAIGSDRGTPFDAVQL